MVHVAIKKLGSIPDGGGWRTVGRTAGAHNKQATTGQRKSCKPVIGYSYIHSAVDDHSHLAYSEVLIDERKETAIAFWRRAQAFFASHGITVERVLTDNGSCYKSKLFTRTLTAASITHKHIRPYTSNSERTEALAGFLHTYTHHRSHTALGGKPPVSRVNNAPGQYT